MLNLATAYTVDDLDWAREALGTTHIEIDEDGQLVVSPATDAHEWAIHALADLLRAGPAIVLPLGWTWKPPNGSGRLNVPDLLLVAVDSVRDDQHFVPAPLLVVEVASPSTRRKDRSERPGGKMSEYLVGRADHYLLVDLPALVGVDQPTVELLTRVDTRWATSGPQSMLDLPAALGNITIVAADLVFNGRIR